MTLCSVTFIFILSNLTIGTYLKKLMALEGPRIQQAAVPKWL